MVTVGNVNGYGNIVRLEAGTMDFLFATRSLTDEKKYQDFKSRYDVLSKRINKYIQWLESRD